MNSDTKKAIILYNLLRRKKIGKNYDRLEHLKRFDKDAIRELLKEKLLITKKGKQFTPVSVNPLKLGQIKEFVRTMLKLTAIWSDKEL